MPELQRKLEELECDNDLLREELWEQWLDNHSMHCTNAWPHPDKETCDCPLPSVLRVTLVSEASPVRKGVLT